MQINHNLTAMNTLRQLNTASTAQGKSMEKLSSGQRINRAGDDAAGLAISEKMRGQIRGLDQAARNSQDGISMIQTAEGALNETHDMLQRMRELVVQANNDTNTANDRVSIQKEVDALATEITDTAKRTEFNTQKLITGNLGVKAAGTGGAEAGLKTAGVSIDASGAKTGGTFTLTRTLNDITLTDGTVTQKITVADATKVSGTLDFDKLGIKLTSSANVDFSVAANVGTIATTGNSATLQIGANQSQTLTLQFNDMQATALGTGAAAHVSDVDVTNGAQTFNSRLQIVDDAIKQVSDERSKMGAIQNRLEHTINNLNTSSENLTSAESRVRDVDYALAA
jgi:flagellin